MGEVVSLGKARKTAQRASAKAQAAENRVKFGRTRAEKSAAAAETARQAGRLDGALIVGEHSEDT